MTSTFFVWWKGFSWSVLVTVIIVFCLLGLSSSQNYSQDQTAIEQALRDALPKEGELPTGITWDRPNYRPEFFDIDWTGHRVALECPYGMRGTRTDMDNFLLMEL